MPSACESPDPQRAKSLRPSSSLSNRLFTPWRPVGFFHLLLRHGHVHALIVLAEYHFTGGSLQHARDRDVDGLRNHSPGVVDHYHRTVIQVGDALIVFLAFL